MAQRQGDWRSALPRERPTRILLAVGALALIAVIPLLWMWLLYASSLSPAVVYAGAVTLAGITIATGAAMIRILDDAR